jgi:hypothetical protein
MFLITPLSLIRRGDGGEVLQFEAILNILLKYLIKVYIRFYEDN